MFESDTSWSLPAHLYIVSGWSARCSKQGDPMSCQRGDQAPGSPPHSPQNPTGKAARLRVDRPHLPPAQARRELGLLRLRTASQPDCADNQMFCTAVPAEREDARHLEPAAATSTPCSRTTSSRNIQPLAELLRRGQATGRCPRSLDRAVPGGERASAGADQRRPDLRHRPDQRDHAEPRLEVDRDLPRLGRLGRLLRPRRAADRGRPAATVCACPALVISPYARTGYIDHQS